MEAHSNPFEPLTVGERAAAFASPPSDNTWTPIVPVPDGAPKARDQVQRFCPPGYSYTSNWRYGDDQGRLMFFAVRFDKPANGTPAEKQFRPFTYCSGPGGVEKWRPKALPIDRPLYGLVKLAARPQAPVLVVEGEKAADAAAARFADHVVVTSSSGAKAAAKTDWRPLQGRSVTLWPEMISRVAHMPLKSLISCATSEREV